MARRSVSRLTGSASPGALPLSVPSPVPALGNGALVSGAHSAERRIFLFIVLPPSQNRSAFTPFGVWVLRNHAANCRYRAENTAAALL